MTTHNNRDFFYLTSTTIPVNPVAADPGLSTLWQVMGGDKMSN